MTKNELIIENITRRNSIENNISRLKRLGFKIEPKPLPTEKQIQKMQRKDLIKTLLFLLSYQREIKKKSKEWRNVRV